MRERFTPARACSTRTLMLANFRLVRFSVSVSVPRGGFFFRLAGFLYCWFIPLESGILVQYRSRRVSDVLLIGDPFVVRLAGVGFAQEPNVWTLYTGDYHVLVAVRLLLAAVVQGLFLGVFRPLTTPFGPIDDQARFPLRWWLALSKVAGIPLRENAQISKGGLQDGQQSINPMVHPRLTQTEEFGHDNLQWIRLEVNQDEQQFLFGGMQSPLAPCPGRPLPGLAYQVVVRAISFLIGPDERRQEELELRKRQSCEGNALSAIALDVCKCDHIVIVSLFRIKSIASAD
jgi:hypothetical protein